MATFYIQLENKLLQISGELTAENISKALGYVPVSPNVTNELSQRVDNITFDSLKDNPFLQDGSGELNIVDESGNIIAKIDADGIHSVDFIAGEHILSDKTDKTYVDEAIKNVKVDLTGYATEEYVNNIDFYNINNNPIVDGEEDSLTLVDENGNIGLIVTEDGLYIKDVIADGHTLSQKIDKSELSNYVTETELNDKGFLTEHQDISHLASKDEVYDSISNIDFYTIKDNPVLNTEDGKLLFVDESGNIGLQLENDKLYVSDVVAGDHILSNKADIDDIPSLEGYAKTEDIPSVDGFVKSEDLPDFDEFAKTEDIPSLEGYAKTEDIPSLDDYASKEWVNNKNYATEYELKTIDYSTINNVPVSEDGTGELNISDESGNIGMKVASEAVYAKDFVAGEHTLRNKQDTITDLETIRQGAAKGATALQSYTEQYTGTVTGVKINGTTKKPSSGVVDLGTVITTHQDISGKQDNLVSGTNIKTINGESLLGSGDIEISCKKVVSGDNMGNDITLKPNQIVLYTSPIDNINVNGFEITPFDIESANPYNGYYDEYCIVFKTGLALPDGSSTFSMTLPSNILWANGSIPEIEANTEYELSITRRAFNSTTSHFKAVLIPFKPLE